MFNNLYGVSSCVWEQMDTGRHVYVVSQRSKWRIVCFGNLLFQISSDSVTFETNFGDTFVNQSYVGLSLYLIRENQKIL